MVLYNLCLSVLARLKFRATEGTVKYFSECEPAR